MAKDYRRLTEMVQAFKTASTRVPIRAGIKIGGAPRSGGD